MNVPIAAACRSPFAAVGGALAGWHPVDLTAALLRDLMERAGGDGVRVDEVWVGCAEPVGAQGADMARAAVLAADLGSQVGGTVVDRAETSGMAALHAAAAAVANGSVRAAAVVGVGCASVVPPGASALARTYGRPWGDGPAASVADRGGLLPPPAAADAAARAGGITREAQDAWARRSHTRRAATPPTTLTAVEARPGDGAAVQRGTPVTADELRTLPGDLAELPAAFDPDGTVTGATFAPAVDGVAAVLIGPGAPGRAPVAELVGVGRAAGDPLDPTGAVDRAAALALGAEPGTGDTVAAWELTEPTAAAALLAIDRLGIDATRVNRWGGTLAVGDAGAAEELRLVVDALDRLGSGERLAAASLGPTGAAVSLLRRP